MKFISLIFALVLALPSSGQNTFSRIYDADSEALRNYLIDFEVLGNNIYTYSTLFCELEDSLDATCVALIKYNMEGDIISKVILDSLNSFGCCNEGLSIFKDTIVIATYAKGEKYKKVSTIQFNTDLKQVNLNKYTEPHTGSGLTNSGVEFFTGSLFLYGSINNDAVTPDSVHIIKTDLAGNELDRFYYSYGSSRLEINNLQATPDGNLAFMLQIISPPGPSGFDGFQLVKVDMAGAILDSFSFEDFYPIPNRLLVTSDGGYVFSSIDHPFYGSDIFTSGHMG